MEVNCSPYVCCNNPNPATTAATSVPTPSKLNNAGKNDAAALRTLPNAVLKALPKPDSAGATLDTIPPR